VSDWLNSLASTVPWPFPLRPSLENLADPEVRHVLAVTLSAMGLAMLLLNISVMARRGVVVMALIAATVFVLRGPNLELLLVDATPASYRPSPTGFSAASIAAGRRVFAANCVPCHGKTGDGEGGLGAVANLRLPHIWTHPVGDVFWFVSKGIIPEGGGPAMPAWEAILPETARWSAIDYIYALNAGALTHGLEGWPHRVPAPAAGLSCPRYAARTLADLRGKAVRIILGEPPAALDAIPPVDGIQVVTVLIPGHDLATPPPPGVDCVALGGANTAEAYAILAGAADGRPVPARFLVDPDGVLRSVWRKDDGDAWADPARMLEEVREICTRPLTIGSGVEHEHHH